MLASWMSCRSMSGLLQDPADCAIRAELKMGAFGKICIWELSAVFAMPCTQLCVLHSMTANGEQRSTLCVPAPLRNLHQSPVSVCGLASMAIISPRSALQAKLPRTQHPVPS